MVTDHGTFRGMDSIPISTFKATCLAVLARVRATGEPVQVTKRGEPVAEIVPASRPPTGKRRLGVLAESGRIVGDIVSPVADSDEWEAASA